MLENDNKTSKAQKGQFFTQSDKRCSAKVYLFWHILGKKEQRRKHNVAS